MQLIEFIFGIAVLIILHELGHFFVARLFKIDVEEFGIGFPPRLATLFEAGGTKFTLNAIPLGGFVRPRGENDPSVEGGLAAANPWVRLAVLAAGPFTNLLVGVVLAVLLFYSIGEPILGQVRVQSVSEGSPASVAGLQVGDLIVQANNQKVTTVEELHTVIYDNLGQPVRLVVERSGASQEFTIVPRNPPPADGAIGIEMGYPTRPVSWSRAIGTGAQAAYEYSRSILTLPLRIFRGQVSAEEGRPVGFKGMFDVYQQIQQPLWFFMAITISLGLFNLFPIPALDGGRILLTLPEIVLRKRIPPQYENMIHLVGFSLLLILLIYINLQDFINPIQLPK